MGKEKNKTNPYVLFLIAAVLVVAAWLMRSFPILVFVALSPLFAIADHAEEDNIRNKLDLVGVALALGFWAAHFFETSSITWSMFQAIAFTLAFVVYAFARQNLGARLGKLPLVLFWLALEYLFLKLPPFKTESLFLADGLALKPDWFRWTIQTGYIGVSCWILFSNLIFYHAAFQKGFQLPYAIGFCVVVAAPLIYSYTLNEPGIERGTMEALYAHLEQPQDIPAFYLGKGEWTARTAAWISVLIVLFALVKSNTRKK
jgi:hypothetical protein